MSVSANAAATKIHMSLTKISHAGLMNIPMKTLSRDVPSFINACLARYHWIPVERVKVIYESEMQPMTSQFLDDFLLAIHKVRLLASRWNVNLLKITYRIYIR